MKNLNNVDYHIINRCNLNCKACGHFAPLVPKDDPYVNIDRAKIELDLLFEKTEQGSRIDTITLTGGEITLNPDLKYIIEYAVKLFPNKVRIWTNAIKIDVLLDLKSIIIDNNVKLWSTDYGRLNTENIKTLFQNGILDTYIIGHAFDDPSVVDDWYYEFFSNNETTTDEAIEYCLSNLNCLQYKNSKLYHCQYTAYFEYFDKYFKGQHNINYQDTGIDLNSVNSFNEIEEFLKTPLSLCKYCNDAIGTTKHGNWETSKKEISEWYGR